MVRSKSRERKTKPAIWVFCEGESEKKYVEFLKSEYRNLIVEIKTNVKGLDITDNYIQGHIERNGNLLENDKIILIYDLDKPEALGKLQKIKKKDILCYSNPCFELWYLLHYQEQTAELSTDSCVKSLEGHFHIYKKGELEKELKKKLQENKDVAKSRAEKLSEYNNPSTNLYEFLDLLEKRKSNG